MDVPPRRRPEHDLAGGALTCTPPTSPRSPLSSQHRPLAGWPISTGAPADRRPAPPVPRSLSWWTPPSSVSGTANPTPLSGWSTMRSSHWTIPRTSIAQLLPRRLVNSHSAALLLISYRGYRFILAYGRGWQAIERSWVDPRFGLRVVANAVSADRVRSVETRTLGGRHLSRYTAMPTAGPLYELGIEPINTLVRQLEGIPSPNLAGSAARQRQSAFEDQPLQPGPARREAGSDHPTGRIRCLQTGLRLPGLLPSDPQ